MFVLELLGGISLRGGADAVPITAQQKRPLSLLAILALSGDRGLSRDSIEAYLWPESSGLRAKHALDQLVYALRQSLGGNVILSGGRELRLNPEVIRVDVAEFDGAIQASNWAAAADLYKGPLLQGFHCGDSRELESLVDSQRAKLLAEYQEAVGHLADSAAGAGDSHAVGWFRKLVQSDPLSPAYTKKLMLALAAAGDRVGAVKHARLYQDLVRHELEMEPDAAIEALAATFSRAATAESESVSTSARTQTSVSTAIRPSIAPTLGPVDGHEEADRGPREPPLEANSSDEGRRRDLSRSAPWRLPRIRALAAMSSALAVILLIGAVTVESRQRRELPTQSGEDAAWRTQSIPAHAARSVYLRGLEAWRDGSRAGLDSAVSSFRQATELDAQYAEAYAALANGYVMQGYFGYRPSNVVIPQGKAAALRSVQLDSVLALGLPSLAYALAWERDFGGADAIVRQAIARDPTPGSTQAVARDSAFVAATQWYSVLLTILEHKTGAAAVVRPARAGNSYSLSDPVIEIAFTKWIDMYPAMAGFTSFGDSTMRGEILSRVEDSQFTHMVARYEITDPKGSHSFKAVFQGKADNASGRYDLAGIIAWGWMAGAHVRAQFQRISPCTYGKLNVCFQGTIRIQRG